MWILRFRLGRFRLFFRYDSRAHIIVYAWINDERGLRQHGGRRDPYEIFRRMLAAGNSPNEWGALVRNASEPPADVLPLVSGTAEYADKR